MARVPAASHRWWTLAAVSLTQLLIVLDSTIVNIALPSAQADLAISDAARQWVVTAYALPFGAFLLLGGRIADYWGRRRTYLLGLAVFGAGSAWGGLAQEPGSLLAARGVQGLAAALMAPAALAFVTLSFPDGRERSRAFAVFGSLAGVGSALGMVLGGLLTELLSWRWCLLVNVPLVVVGLVAGAVLLPESRAGGGRGYDVAGALTATGGFACVVYGLTLAEHSWTAPATVGLLGLGAVLLVAFVLVERRATEPLLPLRVIVHRTRGAAFAVQALLGAVGVGAMVYLALHLQVVLGLAPLPAGLGTLPFTAALMATVPTSIRLLDRFGPRLQMVVGPLVAATGLLLLSRVTVDGGYLPEVLPGVVLFGVGMGLTVVPLNNLALHGIAPDDAGVASATTTATNQLGASIGLAVLTAAYVGSAGAPAAGGALSAVVAGHRTVFALGAVLFGAAAAVASGLLPRATSTAQQGAEQAVEVDGGDPGPRVAAPVRQDERAVVAERAAGVDDVRHIAGALVLGGGQERFVEAAEHDGGVVEVQQDGPDAVGAHRPDAVGQDDPALLGLDG
jgi:EmrB/QacA subfamily drug resistance transporter